MPAPLATAQVSAFGQVVPGAAGLRGGASPCVLRHVVSRIFLLVRAATRPLVTPTTFQPTLPPAIVRPLLVVPARPAPHGLRYAWHRAARRDVACRRPSTASGPRGRRPSAAPRCAATA